jgi:dolichol-phosphate mannosyltransferase
VGPLCKSAKYPNILCVVKLIPNEAYLIEYGCFEKESREKIYNTERSLFLLMLSVIIPAHNEERNIKRTIIKFNNALRKNKIKHEILVINDNSTDCTEKVVKSLKKDIKELRYINNEPPSGFGRAINKGLKNFRGSYVAIVMADLSDEPNDLIKFYREIRKGYDCVFGSRFVKGGKIEGYPLHKLILNRMINNLIRLLFLIKYNDITNAFKIYRKETIKGLEPIISKQFNLTVELPLKAVVRGYSYKVVPNSWTNRKEGISKLKIREMGSRYLFIIIYCLIEKWLSSGDYSKKVDISSNRKLS